MKNKTKQIIVILLILNIMVLSSGCGSLFKTASGSGQKEEPMWPVFNNVSPGDDAAAIRVLNDYFTALFTAPSVEVYTENTVSGTIPDIILEYIAEKTITEGNGNPEIGIHLPRFVSVNGETIIGYDMPVVNSSFISKSDDNLIYFCKISAKATVVFDHVFLEAYEQKEDNSYEKLMDIDNSVTDTIRVEIKYDVELTKEDGDLKVLRAIESNIKPGVKNRLFLLNNESITRLPYLDISRNTDGTAYNNPGDVDIYDAEKAIITKLFVNLSILDRERMNLLSHKWDQGVDEVKAYLDSLGITKDPENEMELFVLTENYNNDYPFESLPLRYNMEKIKAVDNIVVTQHPAYSGNRKLYFVNFDATVQKINGITDEDFKYRYDYLVILVESDGQLIIDKYKLNEYYRVQ